MNKTLSNTNKFWVTLLAAGTLWAGLGLGTAVAVDKKDYPATFCRPTNDNYFGVTDGLAIYNQSTSRSLTVFCPIVRDIMHRQAMVASVKVRYYNPYFKDRQVVCQLRKFKSTGGLAAKTKSKRGNSKTPGGTISLIFHRQIMGNPGTPRILQGEGNYVVSCTIPASAGRSENRKVKLTGYSVYELG